MAIPLNTEGEEALVTPAASEVEPKFELEARAKGVVAAEVEALEAVEPDELAANEAVETGQQLALSDFNPPAISAGERLVRFAYRMGIPGGALIAPFRKTPRTRILATVESPLTGERSHGMALRAGYFLVNGVKAPLADMNYASAARLTSSFEQVIHGFSWLRDIAECSPRQQCTGTAEQILSAWLKANPEPAKGAAWKVDHVGHRLMAWLVHAPLILSGPDKALRALVLEQIAETARWLDRNVERADNRHGEMAGWCALTAAGLLLPEGKPRRLFGEAGLVRALGELVGDDGGVLSRSPVAQMDAIALLVDLSACYKAAGRDFPDAFDTMLQMLVPPLLALTHGDGGLGNWQGSGAVSAEMISTLVTASAVRTRPLREARQWGYQRIAARPAVLHFDASPPPLARHARFGCASTLAFELSHGDHRLIVNCGGAALAGGQVPARIEQGLRATAAHSTLVLGDANSTAVLINGKLGAGVREVEVDRRTLETESGGKATRIMASHDGYASRFGLIHRRILILRDDGSELRGEDVLVPSSRRAKRGKVPFAIRFHLGPQVEVVLSDNRKGASLALPDGSYWQFVSAGEEITLEESLWVDGNGRPHPIQQLAIQGLALRSGGSFGWLLKKMG